VDFVVFLSGFFEKQPGTFFWLGPITSTLKIIINIYCTWLSESNFKIVIFQRAWFSWFYDTTL